MAARKAAPSWRGADDLLRKGRSPGGDLPATQVLQERAEHRERIDPMVEEEGLVFGRYGRVQEVGGDILELDTTAATAFIGEHLPQKDTDHVQQPKGDHG